MQTVDNKFFGPVPSDDRRDCIATFPKISPGHSFCGTAAFESPSLERRNYPELSCIGGLHPAGIPECMPQFNGSPKSHWILGVTLQTLAGSRPERRNCLQFRPVPVLAESESDRPTNRRLGKLKARESTPAPKVNDRTLAAGRIQFMSAWRNARRLVLRPGRPTIHPIWLPRPTLRTCRFKSCRAQQFREWWKTFSPRRVAPVTQVKTVPASRTISSEPYRHSGQTRAVRGGTRPAITGQTQQPNAVQIAIT